MPIIAGIDEAGYGPTLGPLVITCVTFRAHDDGMEEDLWARLSAGVSRKAARSDGRVVIADSKTLYSPRRGLARIEESVLAFLDPSSACNAAALLQTVAPADPAKWTAYPWYGAMSATLPAAASEPLVQEKRTRLARCLDSSRVAFCGARCVPVNVLEFNADVSRTNNKAATLAAKAALLIRGLWEGFGEEGIDLVVDKQGGRKNYLGMLYSIFGGCRIRPLLESRSRSLYEISDSARRMRVAFEKEAERGRLAVAAASMFCKYVRELFMAQLNTWWQERVPGLRPTAGYPQDARRFLHEIEPARQAAGVPLEMLVRCR